LTISNDVSSYRANYRPIIDFPDSPGDTDTILMEEATTRTLLPASQKVSPSTRGRKDWISKRSLGIPRVVEELREPRGGRAR
jgi:hypothetical protein